MIDVLYNGPVKLIKLTGGIKMVTATPCKLAIGNEKTQFTKPIDFMPPVAKKTDKSKVSVTHDTVPVNILLMGGIIGIFILFIRATKRNLFRLRNKRLTAKRCKAKNSA